MLVSLLQGKYNELTHNDEIPNPKCSAFVFTLENLYAKSHFHGTLQYGRGLVQISLKPINKQA